MSKKVEVQKGPIVANQTTMQHITRSEKIRQDMANHALLWSNQSPVLHEPKTGRK